ncbi:MAG: hypothetical protein AAFX99_07275, partial [Myxococcota bacterium]
TTGDGTTTGNGSNQTGGTTTGPTDDAAVTYHRDIRPLMEANCTSCHQEGGVGPFPLIYNADEWASGEPWWAAVAVSSVMSGSMPPWQPDNSCRPMLHARFLEPAQAERFAQWMEEGFPQGDPGQYVAPDEQTGVALPEPDLLLGPGEAYQPDLTRPDDYRCQLLDHTFSEDTFITATDIVPGDRRVVHHVLIYRVNAGDVADLEAREAAEPGAGYACFGGTGASGGGPVAGWVPGSVATQYPDNSAMIIEAGSRLVMQIHYNTLTVDQAPADFTQLALWTMPAGQVPEREVRINGFPHSAINIPAGEPDVVQERSFNLRTTRDVLVIGVAPHMHTIGTAIRAAITHDDGSESCVIDIPTWDFNWQQLYLFPSEQFIALQPGDAHRLTCVYDNSPANQPVVNGQQAEPRDVRWGEGTFDEMCLNYLILSFPYEVQGGSTGGGDSCGSFSQCASSCDGDSTCFLDCSLGAPCTSCLFSATAACGRDEGCEAPLRDLTGCLSTCDDSTASCMAGACAEPFGVFYGCVGPSVLGGACNAALDACDVTF